MSVTMKTVKESEYTDDFSAVSPSKASTI